jgi:hypothetical protein
MELFIVKRVKDALRIVDDEFNEEVEGLIDAGLADLGIAGVNGEHAMISDPLVYHAVVTYCKMHFGEPDKYEQYKKSYDEQKAQLQMASGYTVW